MLERSAKILSKETVFNSFLKIAKIQIDVDGEQYTRMCMERGDAVVITLYDPTKEAVVMVREPRIGPMLNGDDPFNISFPAGVIDSGETPAQTAVKETKEETGATGEIIVEAMGNKGGIYSSAGGCSERLFFFYAEVDSNKLPEMAGHDKNEHTEIIITPLKEFLETDYNTAAAEIGKKLLIEKLANLNTKKIINLIRTSNTSNTDETPCVL